MLYEVMRAVNNYFIKDSYYGEHVIKNGSISSGVSSFIQESQYFVIDGSIFNDGVYKHGEETLKDETFKGTISVCAIPQAFLDLVKEIEEWQEKYKDTILSPYQSESFGGYSYSKASTNSGENGSNWQNTFKSKLNTWRKI